MAFCNNNLDEVISNEVVLFDRETYVRFLLSRNSSEEIYNTLINGFLALEKQTQNKFTGDDYSILMQFGNDYRKNFTINDKLYTTYKKEWCIDDDKCFKAALTDNPDLTASGFIQTKKQCPTTVLKEFTLIISDICLPSLNNKEISQNDIKDCSMKYRNIALMLPTKDDVEECRKQILAQSNELYIDIFSSELDNNIIKKYSDMNVIYSSTMAKSKINLFFLIVEQFPYSLNFFANLTLENVPLCKQGSISAYFQYLTNDQKRERFGKMALPLNYKKDDFIPFNYMNLIKNFKYYDRDIYNCSLLKTSLIAANSMALQEGQEQYNIFYVNDAPPPCFNDFELYWNNTNRHLDALILYSKEIKGDYSKLISLSKDSLNHISFYEQDHDGLEQFWKDTTICRSNVSVKKIYNQPSFQVFTKSPEPPIIQAHTSTSQIWIIIGGTVTIIILCVSVVIMFRYLYKKRMLKKKMELIKPKSDSINSTPAFGKFWNMFLNDKDVIIISDKILGKGSKSTVMEAILTQSTQKVAAKISTRSFDEKDINVIINELNSLVMLKEHPNIIQLKGWTLSGSVPVIITELAETNLLSFVKNRNNYDTKLYLQILYQISAALKYLTEHKMIHRDVACRNILLTEMRIAKLADFGLSCEIKSKDGIYREDAAMQQHTRFPLKWLSIEALMDGIFSEKSDAWSFGILCYEIFSCGTVPYEDMSSHEMIEFLQSGRRLEKPVNTPEPIYDIMKNCWAQQPSNRATFREIHAKLECLLEYYYLPLMKKK